MANSILFQAGGVSISTGTNRYIPVGNGNGNFTFFSIGSCEIPWPFTCTFKNLHLNVEANTRTGVTSGFLGLELYKNGSATGLVASFSGGSTGKFSDTTNSVSVTAGDTITWRANGGSGGSGAWTLGNFNVEMESSSDAPMEILCYYAGGQLGTGYTALAAGTGTTRNVGAETNATVDSIAGTYQNLIVSVSANSRNGDEDIYFRVNGADGNIAVNVPASTTGNFEDASNTDTVATGDDVNYRLNRGGTTGTITCNFIAIGFTGDSDSFQVLGGGDAAFSPTASQDYYMPIGGLLESNLTQPNSEHVWSIDDVEANRLEVHVSTNNITLDSIITLQVNDLDTDVSITIPNETTGHFTNISDTAALASGDTVNYHLYCDDSGDITIRSTALGIAAAAGDSHLANLPSGNIQLTPFNPTATTTENHFAEVPASNIQLTPVAPTATNTENHWAELPLAEIALTGFAPTATVGDSHTVSLPLSSITLASFAPTAETTETDPNHTANLPLVSIQLTSFAPQAVTTGDQIIGNLDAAVVELDALRVSAVELDDLSVSATELDALDVAVTVIQ